MADVASTPDEPNDGDLESTRNLFGRMHSGDAGARDTLLRRYLPILRRMAHGRLPHSARSFTDTDDLVQVTLLSALSHVEQFEPRRSGAFHAYLRQILSNKVVDVVRHLRRTPEHESLPETIADEEQSPLRDLLGKEKFAAYEAALAALSPVQREAVIMRVEMGFTYPEIAMEIGSPSPNAARMLIQRALLTMTKAMKHVHSDS